MAETLPERANLAWLKKTAKQHLRELRASDPDVKLAHAQLALARTYGFTSWRTLRAEVERRQSQTPAAASSEAEVARFLRCVGDGRIDAVRAMLAADPGLADAAGPHPYWGGRPQALHVSIETKRRDMFDLLLASGADVNGRDHDGYDHWSPLMLTVHWNQPDMQRTLLERGARVGLVEALMLADDALVERLLRPGKSALPAVDPNQGSILAFARTPFAVDRLLELGASPDKKDRWGASPIEARSRLGPRGQPLLRHMLARGIQAAPQEHARLGDRETLATLVAADPGIARQHAVMMGAVDFGHHELVTWLLTQGADVNARADWGSGGTALHSAAWNGDLRMVQQLVDAGADVAARDKEHNNTPAGWAQVAITVTNNPKCKDVVDYFTSIGAGPAA
jgi:ankyrin repeat protein